MEKTPKRLVRWALDSPISDFGSPYSEGSSSDADSTSTLQYINSQLIAHGFTYKPGLSLEGTSKEDTERVVKCLLAMLGQRVDDMSRTEGLSTKIRTLSYDHERLLSMYRTATEKVASAERETSLHKSRLASASRTLQSTENAHKHTTSELQRTRTALQALRATQAAEIKKLEKEKERILERWSKLADQQLKLGTQPSGLRFANAEVVEASDVQLRGKGKGFLEVAAEQAQEARDALFHENMRLRGLLLSTANQIQMLLHNARRLATSETKDEPPTITTVELFPMAPADAANTAIASLTVKLKDAIDKLGQPTTASNTSLPSTTSSKEKERELERTKDKQEITRLSSVIETLRDQLKDSEKQTESYSAQVQELFDKLAAEQRAAKEAEPSIDLLTLDDERFRLKRRGEELEADRKKFTDATVRLGKDKASLEAERIRFLEEKRAWQVDVMLAHLPPTPDAQSPEYEQAEVEVEPPPPPVVVVERPRSPRRGSRMSPRKSKIIGVPVGGGKRRALPASPKGKGKEKAVAGSSKIIPAFETEVIPSPSFGAPPAFKTSLGTTAGPSKSHPPIMAPVFVLPPPSPAARLPPKEALLSTTLITPLHDNLEKPSNAEHAQAAPPTKSSRSTAPSASTSAPVVAAPSSASESAPSAVPNTPSARRPFPMAKPLAQHMIHAYSPAKPSPLSRILMLSNSPDSPPAPAMPALTEEDESPDVSPTPAEGSRQPPHRPLAALSLAELRVATPVEDADENPLLDRPSDEEPYVRPTSAMGHRTAAVVKAKTKSTVSRTRTAAPPEKENAKRTRTKVATGTVLGGSRVATGGVVKKTARPVVKSASTVVATSTTAQTKMMSRVGPSKGGPRRVPIDSAEAAPVPRTWKG